MQHLTKDTLKIYWQHMIRYKWTLSAIILLSFGSAVLMSVIPLYIKQLFDAAAAGATRDAMIDILLVFLVLTIVRNIMVRSMLLVSGHADSAVMRDLSNTSYAYLMKHSATFFANSFVGSLVKRVNRFYRGFESVFDRIVFDFIPIIVEVSVMCYILGGRSPWLAVALLVWLAIYIGVNVTFNHFKLKYDLLKSLQDTKVTGVLADTITNHTNVKLFNGYDRELDRFGAVNEELRRLRRLTWWMADTFEAFQVFTMIAIEFVMYYIAIGLFIDGTITIGDFALIQAYLVRIFTKLWSLGRIMRDLYENMAEAKEMTEIMLTPHEIQDHRKAKPLVATKGEIVFDNVRFNYNRTRNILPELSFKIKAGQKIALVGQSGAGKSTIVKLLLRTHDTTKGNILIDGQRLDRVTQESLWENIGMVPQEAILFHRTLMDNIRYGNPTATDEEVIAAAKLAHAHEFISGFPEGYETFVGERGVKLSGGERQRVAIARAMLKNAPILLLDEATSALDSESEMYIQDALETLMKGKTTIVIAHRLSTIMKMDRILVLDQGEIIEDGTHTKLLKKKTGTYSKLWNLQAGGFAA